MKPRHALYLLAAATALLPISCGLSNTVTIQGTGATFPAPLYKRWFLEYYKSHPDVETNYQAIGSGAGVNQFETVSSINFGASDDPLSAKKLQELSEALKVEVRQAPMTGGAVALCYNLPGDLDLKLSPRTYVGMALGEIKLWDDDAIKADNPGVNLPHMHIKFIRRAEGSGTTAVFTGHLATVDDRWKKKADRKPDSLDYDAPDGPGVGKTVKWRTGVGGKGNSGVAALIQQTPGAFGYIEAGYAEIVGLKAAAVKNKAGEFVLPSEENTRAALREFKLNPKTLGPAEQFFYFGPAFSSAVGLTAKAPAEKFNPKGKDAYPISTFTWIIFRTEYDDPRLAQTLKAVLLYCLDDSEKGGQRLCGELGYVALPDDVREASRKAVQTIKTPKEGRADD
jgi:phosphate transport system substrate-binding protein